jgi:hypothetical protein
MKIDFVYGASVANAPAGFTTALVAAASYLESLIINPITITIQVGWGENNGNSIPASNLAAGGPVSGTGLSYSALKTQLSNVFCFFIARESLGPAVADGAGNRRLDRVQQQLRLFVRSECPGAAWPV